MHACKSTSNGNVFCTVKLLDYILTDLCKTQEVLPLSPASGLLHSYAYYSL